MTTRRILQLLVCLVLVAGFVGYWAPWQPGQTQQQQRGRRFRQQANQGAEAVPVLASEVRAADVPVYLDGVGTAKALNTVTVKPQVDGKLIAVSFKEGQDVPKGYVLAKIDPTTYQAQYDQAVAKKAQDEALLANAKLDLERYTKLAASNAVNKQQLDTTRALVQQYEAQVKSDQAAIDNARAILSYTDVTAPIAGRTGIRLIDEGNIVHASDATGLVVITQVKPISVMFSLPQQELPSLNKGMAEGPLPIDAYAPDGTTVVDKGKVLVINNQVDQATGTVQLKAEFPNPDLQLWPGQFVNVRVLINTLHQVLVVPTAAVQRGPDGTYVFVVKDDSTVTIRPVKISQQDDLQAVITNGLTAGEKVVTTGFARLAEGTKVSASSAEEAGQINAQGRAKGRGGRNKGAGKSGDQGGGKGTGKSGGKNKTSSGGTTGTQP